MRVPVAILAALTATAAVAQSNAADNGSIALHTLPAFVGGGTTLNGATPSLNVSARSLRVSGSWQVCSAVNYGGSCQTITADQPLYRGPAIRSVRPTSDAGVVSTGAGNSGSGTSTAKIDLDALDASNGTTGQDVEFYAQPAFGSDQVAAGTNDKTTADAFCKRAGATTSVYASRGRVQQSNLIDLTTATKVRGFALRDVLCRR